MQSTLLKLAFIHALCKMIILPTEEQEVLNKVETCAWEALLATPGTVPMKRLQKLIVKLNKFCKIMKWEQGNLQAALNFSIALVEEMLQFVKDTNRKTLLKSLMDQLNAAYQYFTDREGERYDLIEEGLKASNIWKELLDN